MPARLVRSPLGRLIISLAACLIAGYINIIVWLPLIPTWFTTLDRPAFLLPDSYFIPVTLIVYLVFGITLFLHWQASHVDLQDKQLGIAFLIFTLMMLELWGFVFFGLKSPLIGLMISVLAVAMLLATMVHAVRVSFGAALLLFPLVILVFFAAYENYLIVQLNPALPIFGV